MATFYVGQRVRVVGADRHKHFIGQEAVILSWNEVRGLWELSLKLDSGNTILAAERHLEPLQPEGHKVVSWSECLWQPNPELQNA